MKDAQHKLSKRNGDASFEDLMKKGYLKDAVINYIALLGWNPGDNQEIFTLQELVENFDYKNINKSPAIFDPVKLKWMNGEYIKKLSLEEFNALAKPYYETVIKNPDINLLKISELLHTRTEVLSDIPGKVDFFDELPEYSNELYVHIKMKTTIENSLENLEKALPVLEAIENWELKILEETVLNLVVTLGVKNGQLLWPMRTALSGKAMTPGGAFELADILGKEESIKRIKFGIEQLKNKS